MSLPELTPALAVAALGRTGLTLAPDQVLVERRDHRWVVKLPGQQLAWFAATDEGNRRLATERRVLRLLEQRCGFGAPRVLAEDPRGEFDVRSMVPGNADPWHIYAQVRGRSELPAAIGTAVGTILAEQHSRIVAADLAGWLPTRPEWPEPQAWIAERLPRVIADVELIAQALEVSARYEATQVDEADRVLVHTDVGFHNMGIDAVTNTVHGLYDYDGAACADRHHDFRNLLFDLERNDLLDAACAAYEPLVGRTIDRQRVQLYNAACAITYLAFRDGHAPDEDWCGRTLDQDLRWSRWAIGKVLARR
jgi:hypothetical protein